MISGSELFERLREDMEVKHESGYLVTLQTVLIEAVEFKESDGEAGGRVFVLDS